MDGRMDRRKKDPLHSTGHHPLGAAAQKGEEIEQEKTRTKWKSEKSKKNLITSSHTRHKLPAELEEAPNFYRRSLSYPSAP